MEDYNLETALLHQPLIHKNQPLIHKILMPKTKDQKTLAHFRMSWLVASLAFAMLLAAAVGKRVCNLPPYERERKGPPCTRGYDRAGFYWDREQKRCTSHRFELCGGGYGNMFITEDECYRRCGTNGTEPTNKRKECMTPFQKRNPKGTPCNKIDNEGYYWDGKGKRCRWFSSDRCGKVYGNLFLSNWECEYQCANYKDECKIPIQKRKAKRPQCATKRIEGFYWDRRYKICMLYSHDVCGKLKGTLYKTPTDCRRQCGIPQDEPTIENIAKPYCNLNGILFKIGDKIFSKNDFYSCKCEVNGVFCEPRPCSVTCKVPVSGKVKEFKDGDKWPAPDGCNSCVCRCGQPFCTVSDCRKPKSCVEPENGAIRPHGSSWQCLDGCNRCDCSNGLVISTKIGCDGRKKECIDPFNKRMHASGSYYMSGDGCNFCKCNDGYPSCTAMDCSKDKSCKDPLTGTTHASGSFWRSRCNMCRCHNGQSTCTAMDCTFDLPFTGR